MADYDRRQARTNRVYWIRVIGAGSGYPGVPVRHWQPIRAGKAQAAPVARSDLRVMHAVQRHADTARAEIMPTGDGTVGTDWPESASCGGYGRVDLSPPPPSALGP